MSAKLPKQFKKYFWEFDINKLDVQKSKWTIICRLINKGDFPEIKWLFKTYTKEEIIDVLKNNYNISTKSIHFWAEFFNINKSECRCMQRPLHLRVFD